MSERPPSPTDRDRRVHALFEAAIDLPATRRGDYLLEACPDDPELREEVEGLLRAADGSNTADVLPALWAPAATAARITAAAMPPGAGADVGPYQILTGLGPAAVGELYLGRHRGSGRQAVVEVLGPPAGADPARAQRFLDEARAAGSVGHPNLGEVLDGGCLSQAQIVYLVRAQDGAESLRKRLEAGGRLPPDEAVAITRQVGAALAAVHARGMVHGALQPENLFLAPGPDGRDQAKVTGFGLARLRRELAGPPQPRYLSPEQCRGSKSVDKRADVYALGLILYEMLCGRPPFTNQAVGELLAMHLMRDPPRPRSIEPAIPPAIEAAVLRSLAKDPAERFPDMPALIAGLESGDPVPAERSSAERRRDARQITALPAAPTLANTAAAGARGRHRRLVMGGALLLVAVGLSVALIAGRSRAPAGEGPAPPPAPVRGQPGR